MDSIDIGRVSKVVDKKKFIIKATISGLVEDIIAYPIEGSDEPEVGEEVVLFGLETVFGFSYLYKKMRLFDFTRFKFGDSVIQLTENGIAIQTKNGKDILIHSNGDIDVESDATINIKGKSNISVTSETSIKLKAPKIEMPVGNVAPNPAGGPFNAIKVCPYTGAPHSGNIVLG